MTSLLSVISNILINLRHLSKLCLRSLKQDIERTFNGILKCVLTVTDTHVSYDYIKTPLSLK